MVGKNVGEREENNLLRKREKRKNIERMRERERSFEGEREMRIKKQPQGRKPTTPKKLIEKTNQINVKSCTVLLPLILRLNLF